MTIEMSMVNLVAVVGALAGAYWALGRLLAAQIKSNIDQQFSGVKSQLETTNQHLQKQDDTSRRLEREVMELKAELPRDYVRRDDFVRVISTTDVRIDNLRLTIERLLEVKAK